MPVYMRSDGPTYTGTGQNEPIAQEKASGFSKNWARYLESDKNFVPTRPDMVEDDIAWETTLSLFQSRDKMAWARRLCQDYNINFMTCTEYDIMQALNKYIFERTQGKPIKKVSSISDICSTIRGLFRDIGREYGWENQKQFTWGSFTFIAGNPMTSGTENELKKRLRRQGNADPEKLGGTLSAPMAYVNLVWHLSQLLDMMHKWSVKRYNQVERIENMAYLTMLFAFCMHEGCRYTEMLDHMTHGDLYLPLHINVYWLTFALIDIDMLSYLVSNNKLAYYVMCPYKGKKIKEKRPRMKSIIPASYNSVDLFTIWVFCMRCVLTVNPQSALSFADRKVFKKNNYSDLRLDKQAKIKKVHNIEIKDLTFYSHRYGGAKEDKKAAPIVTPSMTEYRMGHAPNTKTKEKYAANKTAVSLDDTQVMMGMDLYQEPSYTHGITIEFLPMTAAGSTNDSSWLDNAFADDVMKTEFDKVSKNVGDFIESGDPSVLLASTKQTRDISWISKFPIGFHINFPSELMTEAMKTLLDKSIDLLTSQDPEDDDPFPVISEVDKPNLIPELWSFPQIMYGNWRGLINDQEELAKPPLRPKPNPQTRKRPRLLSSTPTPTGSPEPEIEQDNDSSDDGGWSDGFRLDKIEIGDHIVLYCTKPRDVCALSLPPGAGSSSSQMKYVFIAKVTKISDNAEDPSAKDIRGYFYYNTNKNATEGLSKQKRTQAITIRETSVLDIYPADVGEVLTALEEDEIENIKNLLNSKAT